MEGDTLRLNKSLPDLTLFYVDQRYTTIGMFGVGSKKCNLDRDWVSSFISSGV